MSEQGPEPVASRPEMPAGYGIHSGPEGLLSWDCVTSQMAVSRNYWVATTRPDGRPHVMPVWGLWLNEAFYFSTDRSSIKGRNLAANPHLVVHLESGDEVVILEGLAEVVKERILLTQFTEAYEAKYQFRPEVNETAGGVYRLQARAVFAWRESDYPLSATRWLFNE